MIWYFLGGVLTTEEISPHFRPMQVKKIEVVTLSGLLSLSVASRKKLNLFFHIFLEAARFS